MPETTLRRVRLVYFGSNGLATQALYAELTAIGPAGEIAVNCFRAVKTSDRAKRYRGRKYRGASYDRKSWSLENLDRLLAAHARDLGITWGWGEDAAQPTHRWVLYIDLPTGQVSFHTATRGAGPDHPSGWDRAVRQAPERICAWCARLLDQPAPRVPASAEPEPQVDVNA